MGRVHRILADGRHDELSELWAQLVQARALGVLRVRLVFETSWRDPMGFTGAIPREECLGFCQVGMHPLGGFFLALGRLGEHRGSGVALCLLG